MTEELNELFDRRLPLPTLPTPIVPCPALTQALGVEVDLKRDDLIGDQLTGTKVRALAYIFWQALRDGVTDLITIGEATSNQCRLVAMLGAQHGMTCHILLRGAQHGTEGNKPTGAAERVDAEENVEIMTMFGARLQFLAEDEWRLHGMVAKRLMSRARKAGGKALFLPFGCGGLPGAIGIVDLLREILAQQGGSLPYDHIVVPTGSGATLFALDLGCQLLGVDTDRSPQLVGVSVSQSAPELLGHIDRHYTQVSRAFDRELTRRDHLAIDDHWRELSPPTVLSQLGRIVGTYGLLPDPLYVLRAYLALERRIARGDVRPPSRVLVLITGACRTLQAVLRNAKEPTHAQ